MDKMHFLASDENQVQRLQARYADTHRLSRVIPFAGQWWPRLVELEVTE